MSTFDQAEALRREFDQAFAEPARPADSAAARLIVVAAGAARLAFRLEELAGLAPVPSLLALPGGPAAWLGLASVQGELLAVFDLASLVGAGPAAPRMLLRSRAEPTIALAFDRLEGYHRVAAAAIVPAAAEQENDLVTEFLSLDGSVVAIWKLGALVATLAPAATGRSTL